MEFLFGIMGILMKSCAFNVGTMTMAAFMSLAPQVFSKIILAHGAKITIPWLELRNTASLRVEQLIGR